MAAARPPIKLQLLLRQESRSAQAQEELRRAMAELGLEPSGAGTASLSARVTPERFQELFGAVGASDSLAVPKALERHVESISVAPDHLLF